MGIDERVHTEAIAVLTAVEVAVAEFGEIFTGVADGQPIEPAHAQILVTQCGELLRQIVKTRNTIRMSGGSTGGVH